MRYHLTPVRMPNINKSGNNRFWRGCRERGSLLHWWWECKLVQPLWKRVWRYHKKLKIELPYDQAIALWNIYPRYTGMPFWRDTCTPMFIAVLSALAKIWKQPNCPSMGKWIKKMWCVCIYIYIHTHTHTHTHNAVLLDNQKKKWDLAICNYVDGTRGYYAKWNYSEKDKYHMTSLIWGL